jgi:hypothetical protein
MVQCAAEAMSEIAGENIDPVGRVLQPDFYDVRPRVGPLYRLTDQGESRY